MIVAAMLLTMCSAAGYAQKKADNNYNLLKAYEVLQKDNDVEQALDLLGKQLNETPKNTEAYLLRSRVYWSKKEYGNALADLDTALKVRNNKDEIKASGLHWWKADIFMDIKEYQKAADSYKTALELAGKDQKDRVQDISFDYALALYYLKRYDEADAIYNRILKDDEFNIAAMIGLADNMIERGKYNEAVGMLDKCRKLDAGYSATYRFLAKAYDRLGETDKAIDAAAEWFDKDDDAYGSALMDILLKHKSYSVAKARDRMKKGGDGNKWRVVLIDIYEKSCDYELAIKEYDALENEYGKEAYINFHRAECYLNLGLTEQALEDARLALDKGRDASVYSVIGWSYSEAGMYEEAIEAFGQVIECEPLMAYGYYARGWSYELSGNDEKAMEDYNLGIDIDKTYPYIFLMRGELLMKQGNESAARKDFEMILQLDTLADSNSCRMYALHFLGRDDEAEEWMQAMIDASPQNCGNYYDQACLYSRMGKADEAVKAMEKCLKTGYCHFAHIEHDDDLDSIRDREDFKALIAHYKAKYDERTADFKKAVSEPREMTITEVEINRRPGGTFEIPCTVNGLPLNMFFDTGASDVTISSVEAGFMLKNGLLSPTDIKGKNQYMTANGDIHEGTVITLKEVKVGDAVLRNVDASVIRNQKAPLLLGQSVLERFGTITIDNINNRLIIKH